MRQAAIGLATLAMALAATGPAIAHTGQGAAVGFAAGFAHPIGGLDHVLAMVAVGLLAARLGGRALWSLPVAFVTAMTAGALLAFAGGGLPLVEVAIAGSVLAFGLMLAAEHRWSVVTAAGLVAAFAVFHGHAHGSEAPPAASLVGYGVGFVMATALLHGAGIALGVLIRRSLHGAAPIATRVGGAVLAASGLMLLVG